MTSHTHAWKMRWNNERIILILRYRQVYSFVEDRENYMKNPIFGINLNMEKRGVVRVGDPIYATYKYQEHAGNKLT